MSKPDIVNHPPHYNSHPSGVEAIELTRHFNFALGNALKYVMRAGLKGDTAQDLAKALWYVKDEIRRRNELAIHTIVRTIAHHESEDRRDLIYAIVRATEFSSAPLVVAQKRLESMLGEIE